MRGGQFGEGALGRGQHGFGLRDAVVDAAALVESSCDLFFQHDVFFIELHQRDFGVFRLLHLARSIALELREAAIEFADALLGADFLAVEQLAGIGQALQRGSSAGLGLAQAGQVVGADRLDARGLALFAGAFGEFANVEVVGLLGFGDVGMGLHPAHVEQHGLGLADLLRHFAVADRLAGLLLQALHLAGELADHVLDAGEVGLGGLEAQFGLVAAGMQAGDAGGVFQHAAARFGLRLDDFADLALVDEGGRARAGGGVGKENLDIAGTDVAAVDAVAGSGVALDAAGDFQDFGVIDRRGRGAVGIVDGHHHFGVVARGAVAGAGKDHGVHVGGAQRFVRSLAHRPAQRLDQVRLAAAVRPDHAGEAGFDHEIGGFDEGFEPVQAQAREFHGHVTLWSPPAGKPVESGRNANRAARTIP